MKNIVIDVRTPEEFNEGHVAGAMNIPLDQLESGSADLHGLPHEAHITVYCRSGQRAGEAQKALGKLGYADVVNGINQAQVEAQAEL